MSSTKKVVIIGASFAGFPLAQALEKTLDPSYQVILIDERDHFFHCIASLRAATIEDLDEKIYVPFTNTFKKNGKFVQAAVTEIRSNAVVISPPHAEFGEVIEFEYLVSTHQPFPVPVMNMLCVASLNRVNVNTIGHRYWFELPTACQDRR